VLHLVAKELDVSKRKRRLTEFEDHITFMTFVADSSELVH